MKVCEINDCDWWIGESLEACVKDYQDKIEDSPEYTEGARELTEEELDSLYFTVTDENEVPTGYNEDDRASAFFYACIRLKNLPRRKVLAAIARVKAGHFGRERIPQRFRARAL